MKFYSTQGSPPSLAVRMLLKYLNIPHENINVNFGTGEHLTEEHAKRNPQKELPVIEDDGFYLSESIAILQYICDKYKPKSDIYPQEPKLRAMVNHRLCFNSSTYYRYILDHLMPLYYDYETSPLSLKKVQLGVELLNIYLERVGKKYAVADYLTIADFQLIAATTCLEAMKFDLSKYKFVLEWYERFKREYPKLWETAIPDLKEYAAVLDNPPDFSHINHHIHPIRKINKE